MKPRFVPAPGEADLPVRHARGVLKMMAHFALAWLMAACSAPPGLGAAANGAGRPPAPVRTAQVTQQTVPVEVHAIGTVVPYSSVSVKSQVNGLIEKVHFVEGQDVQPGDLLFTLDARPLASALKQAEANLAKDLAQLANAKVDTQRAQTMADEGLADRQQYDRQRTTREVLDATVLADRAAIEKARLDLAYCAISSPLAGRTGQILMHEGNLVKANDTPAMVEINQLDPIYVSFAIPEQYLAQVAQYMNTGSLAVQAALPAASVPPVTGTLSFVDNAVDRTTGTIQLKATFANADRRLWPGQFVDVVLTLTTRPDVPIVPASAVQTGQQGSYVFVLKPDQTVETRPVTVSESVNGGMVVENGLAPGETVITDGQMRLSPGAKVAVRSEPTDGASAESAPVPHP